MLGHKMYMKLKNTFECYALARTNYDNVKKYDIFDATYFISGLDLTNDLAIASKLEQVRPNVVLNCVGLTTRKISAQKTSELIRVNSYFPHFLEEWSLKNNCRLIHFSTDCVFSGKKGSYIEDDLCDARDLYGVSKILGEVSSAQSLTIRSSIVGFEILHKTELIEWLISKRDKNVTGYSSAIYSGVTTNYMANIIQHIIVEQPNLSGVYQLSSPKISKYKLLVMLNEALSLNIKISSDSTYHSDKSLDSTRLFNILKNAEKPNWNSMISEIKSEFPLYQRWAINDSQG